ncbi:MULTISPECIES: methyltransferase domain-containing protein [unclassified Variovorax]|uniref:class I SAM-dependent methyltransferase n=1 Tax=unclassified Variovorax TaxID=663243 RepID=UPI00076CA701|nr:MULTISPECIES: methyltransferase domain-containing protein [unclassified Variovorax]KWT97529.1 Methyltransferase type 11 [Variovorax sp. WDL1]PNG51638.1 Aklanonic acid methyltransferase DnrC [Variovorax sp. B2]PNG54336.1 Aklanonic acid methyltransferase DnrC [Variovorax sp. B4]VTV11830.1 Demethylmenaquinone methyltransferase [Variovorax sp. WDL1]
MEPRLQRRIQRYGWDLAAADYELLWQAQLAPAHQALMALAAPRAGEQVLDVACGTGLVALAAAEAVGPQGRVLGTDLSDHMVDAARQRAAQRGLVQLGFARMDAEQLALPDGGFDLVLCALGLMYVPEPAQALREMRRVLRPGGRLALAVWGERARCGWSVLFPIVDAEVRSEVCPLFFHLGQQDALVRLCAEAGFEGVVQQRITSTLGYADGAQACGAAFAGGPVALAWSRFGDETRLRVQARYLAAIEPWRDGGRYRIPGEFVVVGAMVPALPSP